MRSCDRGRVTRQGILFGITILMTCFLGQSEGFFLKIFPSATKVEETDISSTTTTSYTVTEDTNPNEIIKIQAQVSNLDEHSTQIINSVKDFVNEAVEKHISNNKTKVNSLEQDNNIDEALHANKTIPLPTLASSGSIAKSQTEIKSQEENNHIDAAPEDNGVIPNPKALVTNRDHESRDSELNIVKLPETDNDDIATALEENIRSAVKDEIQLKQNFESPGIDVIDEIPDAEVRQTLTEDLMAIEYPQSVKKDDEMSRNSKLSIDKKENVIFTTETPVATSTNAVSGEANQIRSASSEDVLVVGINETLLNLEASNSTENDAVWSMTQENESTSTIEFDTALDIETTTLAPEIIREITLIPSQEIIHNLEDQDVDNHDLTRQMRGFSSSSNSNESQSENNDTSEDKKSSETESSDSNSSSSSNSSASDSSDSRISSNEEENIFAEDSSTEAVVDISKDASVEGNFSQENVTTPIENETESKEIEPISRPIISPITDTSLGSSTVIHTNSESVDPIEIEEVTESIGEDFKESEVTAGDGKHIIIRKPGVKDETLSNSTESVPLENDVADPINVDDEHKDSAERKVNTSMESNSPVIENPTVSKPLESHGDTSLFIKSSDNNIEEKLVTENHLLDTEIPQSLDRVEKTEITDVNPLATDTTLENSPKIVIESDDELVLVTEKEKTSALESKQQSDETPAPKVAYENVERASKSILLTEEGPKNGSDSLNSNSSDVTNSKTQASTLENAENTFTNEPSYVEKEKSHQTLAENTSTRTNDDHETSTKVLNIINTPSPENMKLNPIDDEETRSPIANEISKYDDEAQTHLPVEDLDSHETSTESPLQRSNDELTTPALVNTLIEAAELTTEFTRQVESFRNTRDEAAAISDEIVSSAAAGRTFNAIVAEGLGKPLPTRSVGDEPSTSSYSSESNTTTLIVLCTASAVIFISFSVAIYLITFHRQHGTLDIEMQEQHCGKDDLEDDEDSETRVTLLNQLPPVDSDENSFD